MGVGRWIRKEQWGRGRKGSGPLGTCLWFTEGTVREGGRGGTGGGSSCLKHKAGSAHSHPQTQMVKINTSQLLGCLEWVAKGKGRESTGGSKFSARFRLEAPLKER